MAEEHRDEFRAVAQYLNDLAELDPDRGIAVWLVEARAVRIEGSPWAPLFTAVVEPNQFTATVEKVKQAESVASLEDFFNQFVQPDLRQAAETAIHRWKLLGYRTRLGPNHVVLEANGPSSGGVRTVVAIFSDGRVLVPFSSYAGSNSGIPIERLMTPEFRTEADRFFGFNGTEKQARTQPGWLTPNRVGDLLSFGQTVAEAYRTALAEDATPTDNPTDMPT